MHGDLVLWLCKMIGDDICAFLFREVSLLCSIAITISLSILISPSPVYHSRVPGWISVLQCIKPFSSWILNMRGFFLFLKVSVVGAAVARSRTDGFDQCPGYNAININERENSLTADLILASDACNLYGSDLPHLKLLVEYQTSEYSTRQLARGHVHTTSLTTDTRQSSSCFNSWCRWGGLSGPRVCSTSPP